MILKIKEKFIEYLNKCIEKYDFPSEIEFIRENKIDIQDYLKHKKDMIKEMNLMTEIRKMWLVEQNLEVRTKDAVNPNSSVINALIKEVFKIGENEINIELEPIEIVFQDIMEKNNENN